MVQARRSSVVSSSRSIHPVSGQKGTFAGQTLQPNPWFHKREGAFERMQAYRNAIEQLNIRLRACQFHPDCEGHTTTEIVTCETVRAVIRASYDHQTRWKQKTYTEMWGSEEWGWLYEEWQDFLELVRGLEVLKRFNGSDFGSKLDEAFRYAQLLDGCIDEFRGQGQNPKRTSS